MVVPRTPQWQVAIRWMESDGAAVAAGPKVLELDNSAVASNLEERRLTAKRAADELERAQAQAAATLADREFAREQRRIALAKARIDADVPADLLSGRDWEDRRLAERFPTPDGPVVYRRTLAGAAATRVRTGARNDQFVEVTAGLDEGDAVSRRDLGAIGAAP